MINNYKNIFPALNQKVYGHNIVYFDNSSTTPKLKSVIDVMVEYMTKYPSNVFRTDFLWGDIATQKVIQARENVAKLINADYEEIIFTSGTTDGINMIANMLQSHFNAGDEIILNPAEHSSLILPIQHLAKIKKAKIIWLDLKKDTTINIKTLQKAISSKTKLIALSSETNVFGASRNIKSICKIANKNSVLTLIDAAQGCAKNSFDVKKLNCDFLVFGAHKMFGPNAIGTLFISKKHHKTLKPTKLGGGMNTEMTQEGYSLKQSPYKYEAGTPHIAEIIGFGEAAKFILQNDVIKWRKHIKDLQNYCVLSLSKLDNVIVYNNFDTSYNVIFNIKGISPQDVASFLSSKGIAVRAGNHCSKLNIIGDDNNTIRVSFAFYNAFDEIDYLYNVLKNTNIENMVKAIL